MDDVHPPADMPPRLPDLVRMGKDSTHGQQCSVDRAGLIIRRQVRQGTLLLPVQLLALPASASSNTCARLQCPSRMEQAHGDLQTTIAAQQTVMAL